MEGTGADLFEALCQLDLFEARATQAGVLRDLPKRRRKGDALQSAFGEYITFFRLVLHPLLRPQQLQAFVQSDMAQLLAGLERAGANHSETFWENNFFDATFVKAVLSDVLQLVWQHQSLEVPAAPEGVVLDSFHGRWKIHFLNRRALEDSAERVPIVVEFVCPKHLQSIFERNLLEVIALRESFLGHRSHGGREHNTFKSALLEGCFRYLLEALRELDSFQVLTAPKRALLYHFQR